MQISDVSVLGVSEWSTNSTFREILFYCTNSLPVSHLCEVPRFRTVAVLFPNEHHNITVIYTVGKHTQNQLVLF